MNRKFLLFLLLLMLTTVTILLIACENQDNIEPTEFELTVNFQGTFNGNKIHLNVDNDVDEFSFVDAFEYPSNYRWELHWDKACVPSLNIVSKNVNLEEGDNILYAIFINKIDEADIHLFEITIHREQSLTITVVDKVGAPRTYSCKEGSTIGQLNIDIANYTDRKYVKMTIDGEIVYNNYVLKNDCIITLVYELNTYTVTFVDYYGNILYTTTCQHGDRVIYGGTTIKPYYDDTIESDNNKMQVTNNVIKLVQSGITKEYSFVNWDAKYNEPITTNTTIKAQYSLYRTYSYSTIHYSVMGKGSIVYTNGESPSVTLNQSQMSTNKIGSYYMSTTDVFQKLGISYKTKVVNIKTNMYYNINSYAFLADNLGVINTNNVSLLEKINLPTSITNISCYAFYNCISLKEIYYDGTMAQWKEINLVDGWNLNSAIEKIVCCDGVIYL